MTIHPKQLIAVLPLLIVGLTAVILILSLSWRSKHSIRNHFLHAMLSVIGLNIAIFSLFFIDRGEIIEITSLICIDNYSLLYTGFVLLTSLVTCIFAYPWLKGYKSNKEEFYLLLLFASLGNVLLTHANHLVTFFLGSEMSTLPLFGLIGYSFRQKGPLEASIKYAILSSVASSFLLFGISLLYAKTGSLSFTALGKDLNDAILHKPLLITGLGMMLVGLGFKLSLVPFHLWTPDVYQGAPAPVSAFLTTASKIAIFGAITRLFCLTQISNCESIRTVLGFISFASIIFGNLMAFNQNNIKRLLGYSSISHLGYLIVALISVPNSEISRETISIYLIGYVFSSLGVFGVISLISSPYRGSDIDSIFSYRGLFWRYPILSVSMTIMLLSLAGIPMTIGFIGKFYLLSVGIQAHFWWLTAGMIIGSVIGLCYYLRVVINLYLRPNRINLDILLPYNLKYSAASLVVLFSAVLVLIFGIYPQPLIDIAKHHSIPLV